MGKIIANLTITNHIYQAIASRGLIGDEQVCSVTLDNVLVDTEATTLCLPADVIAQLSLESLK